MTYCVDSLYQLAQFGKPSARRAQSSLQPIMISLQALKVRQSLIPSLLPYSCTNNVFSVK